MWNCFLRGADLQGQTSSALARVWLDSQEGTLGQEEFSLGERGTQNELVRVGTQIEEEQTQKSKDRGRELLGVMDDRPCERAMNSENGTTKTVTEDF